MDINKILGINGTKPKNPLDYFGIKTTPTTKKKTLKKATKGKRKATVKQKHVTKPVLKPMRRMKRQQVRTQGTLNPFRVPSMSFTTTSPKSSYRFKQNIPLGPDTERQFLKWYDKAMKIKQKIESKGLKVKEVGIRSIGMIDEDHFKSDYAEWIENCGEDYPVDIYAEISPGSVLWHKMKEHNLNPTDWWVRYDNNGGYEILSNGAHSFQDSGYEGYVINESWDTYMDIGKINDRNMKIISIDEFLT